jgi:hypothetical protein
MMADTVLCAYRVCFVALLTLASVETALFGHEGGHAVMALALAEIAGALALLWPRTQIAGACVLLAVFALAQVLSARSGHWPTQFLQYAASTMLILVMGRALRKPVAAPA